MVIVYLDSLVKVAGYFAIFINLINDINEEITEITAYICPTAGDRSPYGLVDFTYFRHFLIVS